MITIHKDNLLIASKYLQRVVPRKPSVPALAGIRVEQDAGETRLIATNTEQTAHITIPSFETPSKLAALRAKRAGAFLIDCGVLANAAATADADTFLQFDRDRIRVQIGGHPSVIPATLPADVFDRPAIMGSEWVPVTGTFDADCIKRLLRAVSRDETRFILQGIFWDKEGFLIGTDGRRLVTEQFPPLPPEVSDFGDVIIPSGVFPLLPPRAFISISKNSIAFVATEKILTIRIFSKRIEGNFPNWRQVCPKPTGNSVRFNNQEAAASLRKLVKITTTKKDLDSTSLQVGPGRVTFEVRKDGVPCGSFTQAAIVTGTPTGIAFNTAFLIDALESGGDTLDYRDEMSPALITGVKSNKQILMPMRLSAPAPKPEPEPEHA